MGYGVLAMTMVLAKVVRRKNLISSVLGLEFASILGISILFAASAKFYILTVVGPAILVAVILIMEGALGLTIIVSLAMVKKEEGVASISTSKW